jgi:uncharacterized protein
MARPRQDVQHLLGRLNFIDTHEHLVEERHRLNPTPDLERYNLCANRDFSILLSHYASDDLRVAGMPAGDLELFLAPSTDLELKWRLMSPWYARCRHTGYLRAVRETLKLLYGVDDLTSDTYAVVSERLAAAMKPGYYRHILTDVAKVDYCQVNSLEAHLFMETEYPDLLAQDLSFVHLSTWLDLAETEQLTGQKADTLKDWHKLIQWAFATYGPRAIAVKNQSAYSRALDYADVSAEEAAPLYERLRRDKGSLSPAEFKALQDHLFNYCIREATAHHLPVKLHTGYFAGQGYMPLGRVRQNAGDLAVLLHRHPQAKFVQMHIDWPYQDEAIALAKHYPNLWVDMCWAWIIAPEAAVRFVREFVTAAPANKLLTFGGDYLPVEMVPGHAAVARHGLAQAISELLNDGWLAEAEWPDLAEDLMRGNAQELFDYAGKLAAWTK